MIKKMLKKIKEFLFGKKIVNNETNCPYKIEPKKVHTEETSSIVEEEIADDILICEHCKKELTGKESSKDNDGAYYIWCNKCNYVNKLKDGKIIKKSNNVQEIKKAFNLFKKAGHTSSSYSITKDGERKTF